jgi:hypothetical protein
MDKRWFRHFYKVLKHINLWAFLVVVIVSGVVSIFALRNNNITAMRLRDKVVQTDKDNGDVEASLRELRQYMYSHMNTSLSSGDNGIKQPIQLKYRYERLVKAEQDRLSVENAKIYTEAQAECEKRFPVGLSGSGRIPCITEYVSARGIKQKEIPDSLYKFDFVSPVWSPDLAGWSLVVASISFACFVVRFGIERWVKAELHDL